jgi:hypothetical protein
MCRTFFGDTERSKRQELTGRELLKQVFLLSFNGRRVRNALRLGFICEYLRVPEARLNLHFLANGPCDDDNPGR